MFDVSKSVKRFRDDPAWTYEKRSRAPYAQFDDRGYPFSLARRNKVATNFLSGVISDYEVTLFHLSLDPKNGDGSPYSVAVVELPWILPATAVVETRLLSPSAKKPLQAPLPFGRWRDHPALPVGHDAGLQCVGDDYEFSRLVMTDQVERLTREGQCSWRIEDNRLIGWTRRHRPYEEIIALAERLIVIVTAFPRAAWEWPTVR